MKKNIGTADRGIRIVLGGIIIAFGIYFQTWWGAIGLLPIATALMGWCPPYEWFGIDTRKGKGGPHGTHA